MNICFVSQEYPEETGWGGIGTYTYEITHGLARLGHKVYVLSRALQQEQVYQEADGVTVYRVLPRGNLSRLPVLWRLNRIWEGYHLAVALKLREIIRQHEIDIIEVPALHGETTFFQYWQRKFPVVVRLHSCTPKNMSLNGITQRLPLYFSHWCERQAVRLAHHLTAPSRAIVKDNLLYLPIQNANRVKVIPNPTNLELFRPSSNGASHNNNATVLFVGRLEQRKGAHILGQAIPLVWQDAPAVQFIFVGRDGKAPDGGSMRKWILRQIPQTISNRITFIDHIAREQLVSLYRQATIVVFPSVWEPFGYVITEAMACGKPVIATRSGGPEEIIDDGETGFLIPPGNVTALAQKINEVLNDTSLLQKVEQAAREKAQHTYDTHLVSRQVADFYQVVVENSYECYRF